MKQKPSRDAQKEGRLPARNIMHIIQVHLFVPHRNHFQTSSMCARGTGWEHTVSHLSHYPTYNTAHTINTE